MVVTAALQLQITCKKAIQGASGIHHDPVVRAARAIVPRLRISRTRLAAQPKHTLAVGGFWLGVDAPARAVMEEAPGLSGTRLSGRSRLHGSGQLGHIARRRGGGPLRAAFHPAALPRGGDPASS